MIFRQISLSSKVRTVGLELKKMAVSHHFQLQCRGDLEQSMRLAGVGESWGKSGDGGTVEAWLLPGVSDVSFSNLGPLNWHLSVVIIWLLLHFHLPKFKMSFVVHLCWFCFVFVMWVIFFLLLFQLDIAAVYLSPASIKYYSFIISLQQQSCVMKSFL